MSLPFQTLVLVKCVQGMHVLFVRGLGYEVRAGPRLLKGLNKAFPNALPKIDFVHPTAGPAYRDAETLQAYLDAQ